MASTAEGARLTVEHQRAQLQVVRTVQAQTVVLWRMIDMRDLDASAQAWAALQLQLILTGRAASVNVAQQYLAAYRAAEIGAAGTPVVVPPPSRDAIVTSLRVTGPVTAKRSVGLGRTVERASRDALASVLGASQRHVLDGGRSAIDAAVKSDRLATGWARTVGGEGCAFCLMLASRGPVYGSEDTADFQPHDECGCQPEPAYEGTNYRLPESSQRAANLWDEYQSTLNETGVLTDFATGTYTHGKRAGELRSIADARLIGFRRFLEGRQPMQRAE